jgi:hypothetical protein
VRAFALALMLTAAAGSTQAAEAYGLKAARAAMSGKSQAVIVAVPGSWVRADRKLGADEAETAGDWSFYFGNWISARKDQTNVVVVTPAEARQLIRAPLKSDGCVTVFIRTPREAIAFDDGCVLTQADYQAGDVWLRTGVVPAQGSGFKPLELKPR